MSGNLFAGFFWRTVKKWINVWKISQNGAEICGKKVQLTPNCDNFTLNLWQLYAQKTVFMLIYVVKSTPELYKTHDMWVWPPSVLVRGGFPYLGPMCSSLNKDKFFHVLGKFFHVLGKWGQWCVRTRVQCPTPSRWRDCFRKSSHLFSFVRIVCFGTFQALHISLNVSLIIFWGSAKVQFSTTFKMPSLKNLSFIESLE